VIVYQAVESLVVTLEVAAREGYHHVQLGEDVDELASPARGARSILLSQD
jgi:hypothetical protein